MSCRYCPDDTYCNPDMHRASLNVRRWLRSRLKAALEPVAVGKKNELRPMKPIGEVPRIDKRTL